MGRGRVQMKLIEKQSERKSVYRKRLSSLKKKAYELSKLCDVPAMIISVDSDGKVETFPENKEDVCAILNRYNLISNKVFPEKHKQNSDSLMRSQIFKNQLELNMLKLHNEEVVNSFDSMLAKVRNKMQMSNNNTDNPRLVTTTKFANMDNPQLVTTAEFANTDNPQLITTAESALGNNGLCADITCPEIDDLSVEHYLHGAEDSSVEHYLHGAEDSSVEHYLHGADDSSVEHYMYGRGNISVEDMHDVQAEESAQSNDVLGDDLACLLDESNT